MQWKSHSSVLWLYWLLYSLLFCCAKNWWRHLCSYVNSTATSLPWCSMNAQRICRVGPPFNVSEIIIRKKQYFGIKDQSSNPCTSIKWQQNHYAPSMSSSNPLAQGEIYRTNPQKMVWKLALPGVFGAHDLSCQWTFFLGVCLTRGLYLTLLFHFVSGWHYFGGEHGWGM